MTPPAAPDALWLWLAIAALGLFHGINPAMGWLFAAALGLNRQTERAVWLSLLPIGLGHALAVAVILFLALALGLILEPGQLARFGAVILFAWAGWHLLYGRHHKLRFGMQIGLGGLFLWSFLMANAHGALHTAVMLATIGTIAFVVYKWVGVAFLRRGWINFDLVWTVALIACGMILLAI